MHTGEHRNGDGTAQGTSGLVLANGSDGAEYGVHYNGASLRSGPWNSSHGDHGGSKGKRPT